MYVGRFRKETEKKKDMREREFVERAAVTKYIPKTPVTRDRITRCTIRAKMRVLSAEAISSFTLYTQQTTGESREKRRTFLVASRAPH